MNGVMLDGAYRLELPDGTRNVIVRNNRVVEADPALEIMGELRVDPAGRSSAATVAP